VALVTGTLTALAPVAHAAPPLHSAPVLAAAPGADDATGSDRSVTIRVTRFEPRTMTPGATVTVTGTLVNNGKSTITGLGVRLQRGEARTTRAELDAAVTQEDPATTVLPGFRDLRGTLAPGGALPFSYSVTSAELRLTADGVYPVLLNVNGTVDGGQRRVGELRTFIVREPVVPATPTTVAWLWPLVDRPHRGPTGGFTDDDLTAAIEHDGRLDRALTTLERLPRTLPPGAREPVPSLSVTLAIDPALVEELTVMAAGPYAVAGVAGAGHGTQAAAAFLQRLRALAAVHPVLALPYGDVDADALVTAGLTPVLTRSLPGTSAGTAQDPPHAGAPEPASTTSASPSAGSTASTDQPTSTRTDVGAGARILADALHATPRTDLAWPAGGSAREATLTALQAGGVRSVVLGNGGLSDGDRSVGLSGRRAAPRTSVMTSSGRLDVLVADRVLGDVVGTAEKTAGGPRMAEQRYLAELAVLGMEAPAGVPQTVLVAPPRTVVAGPDGAGAMMADTAGLPWLRPGAVSALAAGPAVPAGTLVDPVDAGRLDPTGLAAVAQGVGVRDDLAGAVGSRAGIALQAEDAAIARTVSVTWRGNPAGFRAAARDLRATLDRLRGQVTLLAPADGTYTLASNDAPLVLTVRNDLPFTVTVLLDLRTRGTRGLSISNIGPQTLAPGQRTTLQVPTKVHQSGGFAVDAGLTTPSGAPLGQRVEMQVKSTIYGPVSLLITFGAAGLLGLLFLRRLVLFLLRRRRAAAAVPEAPAVVQPPTRSPV
jgi:hypothetical protein